MNVGASARIHSVALFAMELVEETSKAEAALVKAVWPFDVAIWGSELAMDVIGVDMGPWLESCCCIVHPNEGLRGPNPISTADLLIGETI